MEYGRELPKRRPIPVHVLDWQEVYEDFPPEKVRKQGTRCMDCGIPFSTRAVRSGTSSRMERPRVPRRLEGGERPAPHDQQLPRVHRPALPAPCEAACVLGINEPAVTIKQIEVEIIDRAWEEGWVVPVIAESRDGQAGCGRRLRSRRAWPPPNSSRARGTT